MCAPGTGKTLTAATGQRIMFDQSLVACSVTLRDIADYTGRMRQPHRMESARKTVAITTDAVIRIASVNCKAIFQRGTGDGQ